MNEQDRAVYDTTFVGRGPETVATAGLFDMAHDLHLAAQVVGRIASKRPRGLDDTQFANRQAVLKLAQALITRERDEALDQFHRRWQPGEEL